MTEDLDLKLYNEYLNGEKEAFELLYNKYKNKLRNFIFNIVNDYEKAEDITQEVFIYVLKNKLREGYSFKYYIYLIARSRAYSYISEEKRRTEISDKYLKSEIERIEKDVSDIVENEENEKELNEAIMALDEKYKNPIYLTQIEEFSYKETAEILGETVENVKIQVHRGKKELKKILMKKGFREMNKSIKILIIVISLGILLTGITYAVRKLVKNENNVKLTPTFTSGISNTDENIVWVGTFNLVWNDLMEKLGGKIEFSEGQSELADELNKQSFKSSDLSDNSYYKNQGPSTLELKEEIEKGIKDKFNETSEILDKVDWDNPNSYTLYAILKKEFSFLKPFQTLEDESFKNSEEKVKYFGLEPGLNYEAEENVEVLFYNSKEDFAVKLKTKEGEEVYLYRTSELEKSFEEEYQKMQSKALEYKGEKHLNYGKDILKIPFINLSSVINYDELCGKIIKGTNIFIDHALQTVDFELNNYGGCVKSEALIEAKRGAGTTERKFVYNDDFILFLKEENGSTPYFALKVDNSDILLSY